MRSNGYANARVTTASLSVGGKELSVHSGFQNALNYHWKNDSGSLKQEILSYLSTHADIPIYITGHSLGGAMAAQCYLALLQEGIEAARMRLYTYGQPKWGRPDSLSAAQELFADHYFRIMNYLDPVPSLPPDRLYKHCGEEHMLYKNKQLLVLEEIERYSAELDDNGFKKISDNFLALLMRFSQHGMPYYMAKLQPHYHITETSAEVSYVEDSFTAPPTTSSPASPAMKAAPTPITPERSSGDSAVTSSVKFYAHPAGLTDIHQAAISGDLELYNGLAGTNINGTDIYGRTALMLALQHHHDQFAATLIFQGASVDGTLGQGQNLLCYAAAFSLASSVTALIKSNASLAKGKDTFGHTAIYYAVQNRNAAITDTLADKSEMEEKYDFGITILWKAASLGSSPVIEVLLNNKAIIEFTNSHGTSVLDIAMIRENWHAVQTLIISGATFNEDKLKSVGSSGKTILHLCCEQNDMEDLFLFLADCFEQKGWLAPIAQELKDLALANKKVKILEKLLAYQGEYSNEQLKAFADNDHPKTLLDVHSFVNWKMSIKEALIGGDFNRYNSRGNTILYELVAKVCVSPEEHEAKINYIKFLINDCGVDVNYSARANKWTPMHLAVSSHQKTIVELLYNAGADGLQPDIHGYTAFSLAVINGYTDLLKDDQIIERALATIAVPQCAGIIGAQATYYVQKICLLQTIIQNLTDRDEKTLEYCLGRIEEIKRPLIYSLGKELNLNSCTAEARETCIAELQSVGLKIVYLTPLSTEPTSGAAEVGVGVDPDSNLSDTEYDDVPMTGAGAAAGYADDN